MKFRVFFALIFVLTSPITGKAQQKNPSTPIPAPPVTVTERSKLIRDCARKLISATLRNFKPSIRDSKDWMSLIEGQSGIKPIVWGENIEPLSTLATELRKKEMSKFRELARTGVSSRSQYRLNEYLVFFNTTSGFYFDQTEIDELLVVRSKLIVIFEKQIQEMLSTPPVDEDLRRHHLEELQLYIKNLKKMTFVYDSFKDNSQPKHSLSLSLKTTPDYGESQIVQQVKEIIKKLHLDKTYIDRLSQDVIDLVVRQETGEGMPGQNYGVIQYLSEQVASDPVLASDVWSFYSKIFELDMLLPPPYLDDKSGKIVKGWNLSNGDSLMGRPAAVNIWNLALDVTNGDALRAMRVLAVFGHDDVARELNIQQDRGLKHFVWNVMANRFYPDRADSVMFRMGALDGLSPSSRLSQQFESMTKEWYEIQKKHQDLKLDDYGFMLSRMRAANYHYYGGAYLVTELMRRGHHRYLGVNVPVLVSELLGYLYKRITTEEMYMSSEELLLYRQGYPTRSAKCPKDWSPLKCDEAKFGVKLQLLHIEFTHEQHRMGAEWAYKKLKEAAERERH